MGGGGQIAHCARSVTPTFTECTYYAQAFVKWVHDWQLVDVWLNDHPGEEYSLYSITHDLYVHLNRVMVFLDESHVINLRVLVA